ncbi:hypothetical protein PFDG_03268 [Plasmodium falciparum Dd2]|uniref:DNA2/NAM7 helicase-like C-terminal domain-containing protein n=1 Tax=Plasmodium falciparum (isolate Dd2) TaxID=57267 RepID=A0A0L7M315_PLAF4|nr:hypothetical protein PFDG_03268 [Plasmodium falciparum Dd2]
MTNLLKHLIIKKRLNVNYWGVINKCSYSSKGTEYEIFENEKGLEKFHEFKVNKIIYQKDYKNYIKLYKLCNPEYSKLTIEKGNLFNFSIEWIFKSNNIVVRVQNGECKKIKTFTYTLSLLQEKLNAYNILSKERNKEKEKKKKEKKNNNNNNNNNNIAIKSYDINNLKDIYNDEKKLLTRTVEENGNKYKSKINYVKLIKIWDTYLFFKEKKQLEEKKVYFEILKKSFLKAEFFEKNKKKDFEFFENILTSLLLKPSIFINVLNSLHFIFFVSPVSLQVKQKNDTSKENVNHLINFQVRKYILNYLFNIYYEKYIGLKNLYKTFDLHKSYKLKFCRKENDTFKFVSLDNIDVEKRGILLIKYYKNNKETYKKKSHDEDKLNTYNNDMHNNDMNNNNTHVDDIHNNNTHVDEASSLSEYNSLICLNLNCDFIYAFGDEKQLTFHSLINEKKRLDINYLSIFEKLKRYEHIKNHFLLIQYRLIFPMYLFISFYFYNQKLIASKNIMDNYFKENRKIYDIFTAYERVPILFIDTYHENFNKQTFEQKVNYSYINHFEAQIILKLAEILMCTTNQKNVAVLTPYTSQKIYIQNMLENNYRDNTITLNQNMKQENNHFEYIKYQNVMNNSCNPFQRNHLFSIRQNGHSIETYNNNNNNNNNNKNNINMNEYPIMSNKNNKIQETGYIFEHNNINTSIYDNNNNNTVKRTNNLLFNISNIKTQSTHNLESEEENNHSIYKNVHTIDSYQGCENNIIIISTVRSNDKNLLGFLNDEKRMNVLLTRMKKKIIIIGNSNTLKTNFFWKEFISFLDFFNSRKSVFTYPLQNVFR